MDLFSIPIVATAICIVICWAMFAILCSMIHEAVTQMKGERGRFMKKWLLKQLLDHPNGVNWASMLYMHGSVDLLTRSTSQPTGDIESKLFAETLIEVVGNAQLVQMNKAAAATQLTYTSHLLNNFKAATLVLKPSDVVSLYQKAMSSAELCVDPGGTPNESEIYKCLVIQIEHWYHEMCERLSYWYKKRTQARLFALGVLVAVILNIDTIELYQTFESNASSRKVVMNYYESNVEQLTELAKKTEKPMESDSLKTEAKKYIQIIDSLSKDAQLPIGVKASVFSKRFWDKHRQHESNGKENTSTSEKSGIVYILILKIVGFILSGLAASFGAPFWFDLLKKVYSTKPQTVK